MNQILIINNLNSINTEIMIILNLMLKIILILKVKTRLQKMINQNYLLKILMKQMNLIQLYKNRIKLFLIKKNLQIKEDIIDIKKIMVLPELFINVLIIGNMSI